MDEATLAGMAERLCTFVNENLKPLWIDSMTQAASKPHSEIPRFILDPMVQGVAELDQQPRERMGNRYQHRAREANQRHAE
jgi:hypothetical protein